MKKRLWFIFTVIFCLTYLSILRAEEAMIFKISDGGKSACRIITPSKADDSTDHSVAILKKIVKSVTKLEISITPEGRESDSRNLIVIGEPFKNSLVKKILIASAVKLDKAGGIVDLAQMKNSEQGFIIQFAKYNKKNCVVLSGNTSQGTFYAVQTFCDRIYKNSGGNFCLDRKNVLTAPAIKYRSLAAHLGGTGGAGAPQFEKSFGRKDGTIDFEAFIDWVARYKVNNLNLWLFDLSWGVRYPSKKYPEAVDKSHPNVKHEFFGQLLKYAKKNYIDVWAFGQFPTMKHILKVYPEFKGTGKLWKNWNRWVCANKPGVMKFWKGYWEEVLTRYPDITAIGGQWGEVRFPRCQCSKCNENFDQQQWLYFKAMVDVAEKVRPGLKYWMYFAYGGREIPKHRKELPNLTFIHWGDGKYREPSAKAQGTRVDWYLTHGMARKWYESYIKRHCLAAKKLNLEGIQKRMMRYHALDKLYFALCEFGWSPELTWDEFTKRYVIRKLHIKNDELVLAYKRKVSKENRLINAIKKGNFDAVKKIIQSASDINEKDIDNKTVLLWASLTGSDINEKDIDNKIALWTSLKGLDINEKDIDNHTALHWASQKGYYKIVKLLIKSGADMDVKNNNYDTKTALHWASEKGYYKIVKLLIESGADMNIKDRNSGYKTALCWASQKGHYKIVKLLIKSGADMNIKDRNNGNKTALHWASQKGRHKIVKFLIKSGIDINVKDEAGWTSLSIAVTNEHKKIVKLLLKAKAKVNVKDNHGETPLHWAIHKNSIEITGLLLKQGADINAKDMWDCTPLHFAGHVNITKLLLKYNPKVNSKDKKGKTPLYYAIENGNIKLAKFLIETGADVKITDNEGVSPLDIAIKNNNTEIVKLLTKHNTK
jgi:ankyrin repeat protein